ncbi:hypothetical protein LSH36_1g03035 [Paralvinella palmiformis]|uniref:G-protein coupled receptors family 1 profile domain-containing protein n=1 Tax=Paralvinella palmiformis TaxID=53620 RepID=A0AAD9NJJ5_9ANNE|nr:hypothetical protein LSH36_1g03035 [Paralvinella palmiformis]
MELASGGRYGEVADYSNDTAGRLLAGDETTGLLDDWHRVVGRRYPQGSLALLAGQNQARDDDDDGGPGSDQQRQFLQELIEQLHREVMNNWTERYEEQLDVLKRPVWRGLIVALYISIIVVGLVGNGIVVFVVAKNRHMHNITNIFIANLALSDIGLCAFSLPVQLYYQVTDSWVFGESMCQVIFAAFAVPMYVSTLTILLIAFDRYWLIVYPLRSRITIRTAFLMLAVSAVLSLVIAVPVIMYSTIKHIREPDIGLYRTFCYERWPSQSARLAYTVLTFLFQFCLPISMTAALYYRIYCRLRHRPAHRVRIAERKQKTNKILVAIVTLFVVCWLPWNVFSLLSELDRDAVKGPHFKFVDLLLKAFAMGSACVNPFLYCWLNENFRKELDIMAIKMHIYESSALQHRAVPTYRVEAPDDNGLTGASPCTNLIADRMSTTHVTIERSSASFAPDNCCRELQNGQHLFVGNEAKSNERATRI